MDFSDVTWPTHLTLDWLLQNSMPVFVRNTTRPRGQVSVNFTTPVGHLKTVKVPRTHLPIELSAQLSPDTLAMSDDFRAFLVKGALELVRPDEAIKVLQHPDNAYEIQRLNLSQFSAKQAFVSDKVKEMEGTVGRRVDADDPTLQALGTPTALITPRIQGMVERLRSGDLNVKAAMSELRTMEGELKDMDLSYLISNTDGQIKAFSQKLLAARQGKQIDELSTEEETAPDMTEEETEEDQRREAVARGQQQV